MKRSLKQTLLGRPGVAGAILGVGMAGAAIVGVASAQTPTPPNGQNPAASFIQRLAQNLGLPQDKVTQALQATRNDILNEDVAAGRLTQAQADALRNRPVDQGPGFGFGGPGGRGRGPEKEGGRGFGVSEDTLAQRLGLSAADLRTRLEGGQSLAEIAQAKGIDEQTLINQLVGDAKTKLGEAVTAGRLTQAQADQMAQSLPDRIKQKVEEKHTPGQGGQRPEEDGRQHGPAPSGQGTSSSANPAPNSL